MQLFAVIDLKRLSIPALTARCQILHSVDDDDDDDKICPFSLSAIIKSKKLFE